MSRESIDFKSEKLFPFHFQLFGIVFFFTGVLSLLYKPYLTPIFILLGAFILSGYQGVEFDRVKRVYREYNSFFFMKFGKWGKYDTIEKIFINSSRTSQKIYTRVTEGVTVKNLVYNAYLLLGNGSKIYLIGKKDKKSLHKKLSTLSDFFQLEIHDNTT